MQQSLLQQPEALARQVVMPVVIQQPGEGVKNQQPGLNPQLVEVSFVHTVVHFCRDEAPVVKAAVEGMKQLENLRGRRE
jgi:hypothetical protein